MVNYKISFKYFLGIILLFIALFIGACQTEPECINDAYNKIIDLTKNPISESIELPSKIGEIEAKYYSDNRLVMENDGTISQPKEDVEVKFVVEMTYQGIIYERTFTVQVLGTNSAPYLTLTNYKTELKVGEQTTITANYPADFTVSWSSENDNVVTVQNGVVTAVGQGTAKIIVKITEKTSVYKEIEFKVTEHIPEMIVQCDDTALIVGQKSTISVTLEDGYTVVYSCDNNDVVTVQNGVVTAVGQGTANVTVKVKESDSVYEVITFVVSEVPAADVDILEVAVNEQVDLNVLLKLDSNDLSWISNDGDIATVENGILTAKKAGITSITVVSADSSTVNLSVTIAAFNNDAYDYYNNKLSEESNVFEELRTLITNTHKKKISYNEARSHFVKSDADPNKPGNIILFYSRVSVSGTWDGGKTYDREHVWPQSTGWSKDETAGADLHHIRPTIPRANSTRNNRAYAYCPTGKQLNITFEGATILAGLYTTTHFEPIDQVKGDVARIIMYLLLRYEDAGTQKKLTGVAQSIELLLEWNELDPVDQLELNRNNYIESLQGNRNPFIDNADLADLIW